ncbi:MAG: glycoside hydrolase family 127 protein [Victivallales bacterium]|nr:glycoside hydrolase family 127 protein [Victivallales bacterium]
MEDHGIAGNQSSPHSTLKSLDVRAVQWSSGFWTDRFRQCCEVTLPHLYQRLADPETGHALTNMKIEAGLEEGEHAGTDWQDAWVYKWLEAAAVCWAMTEDAELDQLMDETIGIVAQAQQPDGYIATQTTVRGRERFQQPGHHELYTMGHLLTAACLHHRLTSKTSLLEVAVRAADYVWRTFKGRDPELAHFPYNPSIIMGAVELYRTTGNRANLDMANLFIDMRGAVQGGNDQCQDTVPLREETEVVGHAVFYTYLYAGAADAYMETGDRALLDALERLWHDFVETKMYVHGGTCAMHQGLYFRQDGPLWGGQKVHEAVGHPYELPNSTAYNETCGQVGATMWNWRMLLIDPQAKYADIMERQIYNSILSGIGMEGDDWFYSNVLRWYGKDHRLLTADSYERFQPGDPERRRAHICCPTNLLRTVAEWHNYQYTMSDDGLWVHHFGANTLAADTWKLTQETDYPWDGAITFRMAAAPTQVTGLMLRIPGWAGGATIAINGEGIDVPATPGNYARISRQWSDGDVVTLCLPMRPFLIEAHPKVEALRNHVAVQRGPIVYCLESPDLPAGVSVPEIRLPRNAQFTASHEPEFLHGVTVLECQARRIPEGNWTGTLYRPMVDQALEPITIRLIPYYAWANRGISEMTIWMPVC